MHANWWREPRGRGAGVQYDNFRRLITCRRGPWCPKRDELHSAVVRGLVRGSGEASGEGVW